MNTNSMLSKFRPLVNAVRKDHREQKALVGGGHDFTHALLVGHYALTIGGDINWQAWIAAICHNTDRLFPKESHSQIEDRVKKYLLVDGLGLTEIQMNLILEAVMEHSKRSSPYDNPITVILKDSDKLANIEPLTTPIRAAQWQSDLPPINLAYLKKYPPGCKWGKPGSILMDLEGILEWEGECEYEPGKKIPWLRTPKAVEIAKPMFAMLRQLVDLSIQNYGLAELIPYPFPEDFEMK